MESLFHIAVVHAGVISDAPPVASLLRNILDFLLSIAGIIAIIGLVAAGAMYLMSGGDEDRVKLAKRSAWASIVGLIVVFGAWAIVSQLAVFFS